LNVESEHDPGLRSSHRRVQLIGSTGTPGGITMVLRRVLMESVT